jgi:hypothetical protein
MVRVTAELLSEGMRADAPLEARLVERAFQFGGGLGGGEVEEGSGGGGDRDENGGWVVGAHAVGGEHGGHRA